MLIHLQDLISTLYYSVHFFRLARMHPNQGRMAPYPNILQREISFSKLNVIEKTQKMSITIRDTEFGIFVIIQMKYVLGYNSHGYLYSISTPT